MSSCSAGVDFGAHTRTVVYGFRVLGLGIRVRCERVLGWDGFFYLEWSGNLPGTSSSGFLSRLAATWLSA